jgi:hypothetical protein
MQFKDHEKTAKKYKISGGGFWRAEPGENRIRVLTPYEAYGIHWIKSENRSHICIGKDNGCKYCKEGDKPKAKFLFWILDRKDGEVKLAETGYQVVKQLGKFAKSDDWKFNEAPDYDITITKTGEGLETEYVVIPSPNKGKLTKIEQDVFNEAVKPIEDIIEKMKEKEGKPSDVIDVDKEGKEEDDEEVDVDGIPF